MKTRISLLIAVASAMAVQTALAQTWTYDPDTNMYPNEPGQPFASPGYQFGSNAFRSIVDDGGGDLVLEIDTGPDGDSNSIGWENDAPNPNWNVSSATGYSIEWKIKLDPVALTTQSAASVFAGNGTNWAFMRFYNPTFYAGEYFLTAEMQSADGNPAGKTHQLGNPLAWHTYRMDVQGSTAKLYVDNYHSPVITKTLPDSAANAVWFGDGTGTNNGKYKIQHVKSWQNGVVGAPARPDAAVINHTLFSASYDGITGNGGLNADFARGSNQAVGTGAILGNPGKFGDGAVDTQTASGTLNYPTAGNFNAGAGTVEMWVKPSNWNNGAYLGFFDIYEEGVSDIRLQKTDSNHLQAYMGDLAGNTGWGVTTPSPVSLDSEWHHIAWSWDEDTNMSFLYVDGTVVASLIEQTANPYNNLVHVDFLGTLAPTIEIGSIQGGSAPFEGLIDELRISGIDLYQGGNFTPLNAPFSLNEWGVNASGDWSTAADWKGNVAPDGVGVTANFLGAITAPVTINLDAPRTLGVMKFDSAASYTIAGTNTLTLEVGSPTASARVSVANGNHVVAAGVQFNSNVGISTAAGTSLSLTGDSSALDGLSLTKLGTGSLKMKHVRIDTLDVQQGMVQVLSNGTNSGTSKVRSLTIASGASLDLTNNGLVIDYSGGSMYDAVAAEVLAGRLTSSSMTSSTAIGLVENSDLGLADFGGQIVDGDSLLAQYTLKGDSNLDKTVNFDDLLRLAQNYNVGIGAAWFDGDSNYDAAVSFDDLLSLAQNYGSSLLADGAINVNQDLAANFLSDWQMARSLVPEPTTFAVVGMGAGLLLRRRRR